jgi:predicted component of type VI protein secretion system
MGADRQMGVFLEPVDGKGLKIPIDKAIVFIGRHPECDVVITRSRMISRKHCCILQIGNRFLIRDLGSTNGVRINRRKVRKEDRFNIGDMVTIGDLDYSVTQVKAAEPERRPNRDHPQDARAAGAIPLKLGPSAGGPQFSEEVPVAIPDDEAESFDEDSAVEMETSDSIPVISEQPYDESDDPERPIVEPRRRFSDSDSHIPVAD